MVPFVGVPETIASGMSAYREVFCREAGFEHVSRYVSGLLLSENKTLQGIHAQQVYLEREGVSRRAMHAAVFEAPECVNESETLWVEKLVLNLLDSSGGGGRIDPNLGRHRWWQRQAGFAR